MRKLLIPVALFAALATMTVSCQKEDVMDNGHFRGGHRVHGAVQR